MSLLACVQMPAGVHVSDLNCLMFMCKCMKAMCVCVWDCDLILHTYLGCSCPSLRAHINLIIARNLTKAPVGLRCLHDGTELL